MQEPPSLTRALYASIFPTPRSLGAARAVGIRPRRRIFYDRWLANHSYNRCGWSALTAKAVLARAGSMCLVPPPPSPSAHPVPPTNGGPGGGSWDGPTRSARLLWTMPTFGPGKNQRGRQRGAVYALEVLGLWRAGGSCAPVQRAPQPLIPFGRLVTKMSN